MYFISEVSLEFMQIGRHSGLEYRLQFQKIFQRQENMVMFRTRITLSTSPRRLYSDTKLSRAL
ncbi:hypothetical protein BBW68_00655 [Candidatus Erwinia dacicola]|uniref:Uncharacterized protein n=1 Tax=Candidatus Erwinia dacicola TaxID=252393 RepID=A0A1E7Z4G0_9GAMM|nr:hypothetical protein BBW68_00655 [Candidatus Erwinia dacicola]